MRTIGGVLGLPEDMHAAAWSERVRFKVSRVLAGKVRFLLSKFLVDYFDVDEDAV